MVYPGIYPAEIFDVFERERFDYIHVHHPMFVGPWALWLGRKYGIPVIYTYHTRYEDYLHYIPCFRIREESTVVKRKAVEWIQKKVIPAYMRWFCNRCDLVLAPSEGMQQMIKGYGVNTPIAVFPTGLDESFFRKNAGRAQEIRETCSRGKRHLLVTVSRLEKEKNYGFLLRGITELERKMGDDFHVLIIGDGSQKAELKVRASILGIRDKVTFAGNIPNDQVKDYLNAADLFLFASKSETQGIVLAEALAAGIPVVAVHAVGSDDIIRNGENGFLTAEREDEWAEKVIDALYRFMDTCGLDGYDEESGEGLRHIVVREVGKKYLVTLVSTYREIKGIDYFIYLLDGIFREYSFFLNVNTARTNVVFGEEFLLLKGKPEYESSEGGILFEAGPNTFLQVNEKVRERMYARALSLAVSSEEDVVIDCYAGGGLLTAMFAEHCGHAYGIELVPEASACADSLREKNGLTAKMTNLCGRTEELLPPLLQKHPQATVVLDPPRAGLARSVVHTLLAHPVEKLLLISCNPATLARDLGLLTGSLSERDGAIVRGDGAGMYKVTLVQPYDMFSQTKHVETLVMLKRKNS